MNKLMKLLICLVFFFNLSIGYSQNDFKSGYIVSNELDTTFGLVDMKSNYQNALSCTFKINEDATPLEYSPDQIHSYRFIGGKYYVSKTITIGDVTLNVFLEYLVNGYSKLYYYKALFDAYYFIEKDSGKIAFLENKEILFNNKYGDAKSYNNQGYKGVLRYLYKDDEKISKHIDKAKFNSESLIKLSEKYHHDMCPDKECIVYVKESTSNKWYSFRAGINHETMKLSTSSDKVIQERIFVGLQLRKTPRIISSRWNFIAGINFSQLNTEGDFKNEIFNYTRTFRITLKSLMVEFPIKFGYNIFTGKFSGGFYFGFHPVYYINPEYKVRNVAGNYSSPWDSDFRKFNLGLNTGINVYYQISDNTNLMFQCGYEFRKATFNKGDVLDYIHFESIPVSIGLEHKFK